MIVRAGLADPEESLWANAVAANQVTPLRPCGLAVSHPPVVERYRQHLGRRHLDVGPGTGYFIKKAAPPVGTVITLPDANPEVLPTPPAGLRGCTRPPSKRM